MSKFSRQERNEVYEKLLNINDSVESWIDYKVAALKRRVEK